MKTNYGLSESKPKQIKIQVQDLNNKSFEFEQACVIFTNDSSVATGQKMPKLYVQIVDAYRFQREWTLQFRYEPGDAKKLYWESRIYQHPGRREICELPKKQAENLLIRFLELCDKYPSLLFNKTGEHTTDKARPRNEGFVSFAERLHRGEMPDESLL